ncbi:MAG: choice-of-anchor D domain-containing protein [Deinococcota bacterium]|nr:choice-of-anchor D domain-containing protein [Deinococcota bacterium]
MKNLSPFSLLLFVLAACGGLPEQPGGAPAAPTNLEAFPGDGEVRLSWDASGDATGYHVYRGASADNVMTAANRLTLEPETTTSYLDPGLANGVTYYYVVTAVDAAGRESPAQAPPVSAMPQPGGEPGVGRLAAQPSELVFSGVQGEVSAAQSLTLSNQGDAAAELHGLELSGEHAAAFSLSGAPALPFVLEPGAELSLDLTFTPADTQVGSLSARLELGAEHGDDQAEGASAELYGLSARGLGGRDEPTLQEVVATLGYTIDIGSDELEFGQDPAPLGDEVLVPRFRRAGPGEVGLRPVARYSPDELVPFGYYTFDTSADTSADASAGVISYSQVAQIEVGQDQTLNPAIVPGGESSFDPGDADFGVYVRSQHFGYTTHTEDHLNTAQPQLPHAVRVYPIRDRSGEEVANSYLLAFEDWRNGDFQDYVFVISNVAPAAGGPTPAPQSDAVLTTENRAGVADGQLQPGFFNDWLSFSRIDSIPDNWPEQSDWTDLRYQDVATLRLRNEGAGDDLVVVGFDFFGQHADQFAVRLEENPDLTLPFSIAAGAFEDVQVTFLGGPNQEGDPLVAPVPPFCSPGREQAQQCAEVRRATMTIVSNATGGANTAVELAGAQQTRPEWVFETSLTQLAMVFGYGTDIGEPLVESSDSPLAGDEIREPFWTRADSSQPVYVRQMAAFHGCCLYSDWFDLGSANTRFFHHPDYAQSIFPPLQGNPERRAQRLYNSPPARFEIRVGSGPQVYTTNVAATESGNLGVRMWPVKDRSGAPVPNAYLVAQDYVDAQPEQEGCGDGDGGGVANCDYNDNVYLITNIEPAR